MEIRSIAKETASKNKISINNNLEASLKELIDLKEYFIKSKKIEDVAQLREIEKRIEKSLQNFKGSIQKVVEQIKMTDLCS